MKNILVISKDIYPIQNPRSFRTTELVNELYKRGNELTVVCAMKEKDFNLYKEKYPHIKIENLGFPISFIDSNYFPKFNFLYKVFNRILYNFLQYPNIQLMFSIKHFFKTNIIKYDLMITVAYPYPIHWGAALGKTKENKNFPNKWIADCGDPFMGNKILNPPFYFAFLEKLFCARVDKITIPVEVARKSYYSEFHHKIEVIPQGFDFSNIQMEEYVKNGIPTFVYAGVFYKGSRDPRPFLDYLSTIDRDFRFIVYTNNDHLIKGHKVKLKDKLVVKDSIPRVEILKELAKADFLLNIENETTNQVPSKLIDYALSKRPILSLKMNNDYKMFDSFLDGNYENSLIIENLQDYNIKNVVDKFLKIIAI